MIVLREREAQDIAQFLRRLYTNDPYEQRRILYLLVKLEHDRVD